MTDRLSDRETRHAAAQGWQLCDVFDLASSRWQIEVLPTEENEIKSTAAMQRVVYDLAACNDSVAIHALRIIVRAHQPKPKPRRKKKT